MKILPEPARVFPAKLGMLGLAAPGLPRRGWQQVSAQHQSHSRALRELAPALPPSMELPRR